jgi:hypothetical protein
MLVKGGNLQPGQGTFGDNVGGYDAGHYVSPTTIVLNATDALCKDVSAT